MALQSDISLDVTKFDPSKITEKTKQTNEHLIKLMKDEPRWYEVGAEKYRQMRWNGETPFPAPQVLKSGKDITIPSRESGRTLPCRVFVPENVKAKGVLCHIHGGGWVLSSEKAQDSKLKYMADHSGLTVVSVGYRLAPEHPYPQGNEDCFDAAEWLVDHAEKEFGGPLLFAAGDSAGGHLTTLTTYHLLKTRPNFAFKGIVLNYGAFNIAEFLPAARNFDQELILTADIMEKYIEAYVPKSTVKDRRDMWISPFYADLTKMKLPPALFVCGTLDPLLDDSVMMSTRWLISGHEAILKIYPGAAHGFTFFPLDMTEETEKALKDTMTFVKSKLQL